MALPVVIWILKAQHSWAGFSEALVPVRTGARPDSPRTAPMSSAFPQSLLQLRDWTTSMLCSASDLPAKGFSNQIPLVARGNCTFYDKVRLAQGSGAHGLLIVSKETLVQLPGPTEGKGWRCPKGSREEPLGPNQSGHGDWPGAGSHSQEGEVWFADRLWTQAFGPSSWRGLIPEQSCGLGDTGPRGRALRVTSKGQVAWAHLPASPQAPSRVDWLLTPRFE